MGLLSRIRGRLKHSGTQADTSGETVAHKHIFSVPMQWEFYGREYFGDGSGAQFKGATVTKLRCNCGISKRIFLDADTLVNDLELKDE
jgi:hypothetical protein